ncbi:MULTISPECIES: hypothetical protein [unclassified Crossiella]|uniref:phage tail protein n=1 Tax=unclassified Crossiella TaxID=2620835 RepID=UPI001FFF89BC|nr:MULTISPECIES: hypothetical protein [unclassified Crossiella]MCK2237705.1 hypothetical protein [Crossiella sp. S99.2]MCK2254991.1 hypothetical protein [Crossiella sp. S99.1]
MHLDVSDVAADARRLSEQIERTSEVELAAQLDTDRVRVEFALLRQQLERQARPIDIPVRIDRSRLDQLRTSLVRATGDLTKFGLAATTNLAKFSIGAAAAAAAGGSIVAVLGAMSTASGSVAILPAVLLAGAAAFTAMSLGAQGFGEALKAVGDPAKFAEAIGKLSPAARAAAVAVRELAPAWRELRMDVQEKLFFGVGEQIRAVGGTYLPLLRTQLAGVADALNDGAFAFTAFALRAQTVRDVERIFDNSRTSIRLLATGIEPLLAGLRDVAAVASDFLPELASGAAEAAKRFGEFIAKARESGRLHEWISTGLNTLRTLGQIIGNLIDAVSAVLRAGQATGGGLLQVINQITAAVAGFLRSAEGQNALSEMFSTVFTLAQLLLPLLLEVAQIVGTVVAPAIRQFAEALLQGGGLHEFLIALGDGLAGLAVAAGPLGQAFSTVLSAVSPLLPRLGELAGQLLKGLAEAIANVDWDPLIDDMLDVLDSAEKMIDPITDLISMFLGLLSGTSPLSIALDVLSVALRFAGAALDLVADIVDGAIEVWERFSKAVGITVDTVKDDVLDMSFATGNALDDVADSFLQTQQGIVNIFSNAGNFLVDAGRAIVRGFMRGIELMFPGVRALLERLTGLLPEWKGPPSRDRTLLVDNGRLVMRSFLTGLESGESQVRDYLSGLTASLPGFAGTARTAEPAAGLTGAHRVTINVYPQPHQSPESIAAQVARQWEMEGRLL